MRYTGGLVNEMAQQRHQCLMDQGLNPKSGTLSGLQVQKTKLPPHGGSEWLWCFHKCLYCGKEVTAADRGFDCHRWTYARNAA